ncbi:AAA family ATPase [Fodinicola acaciae]|uniref:AAA family ATPase n=1 Tax=Fodinicola acaciae TaxID=2681555 RepID=UPI001C9E7B01|nr:AAA family ATPase [Fodinicola acaciae]
MRESQRAEVAQIASEVTRHALTHSNVLLEMAGEMQVRLPDMIRGYAQLLLPAMAATAVQAATPDPAATHSAAIAAIRASIDADLPGVLSHTADRLLPELADRAVREAAPDVRAELVASVDDKVTEAARDATTTVIRQATDQVSATVAKTLEAECDRLAAEVVTRATAAATKEAATVRAELVREATEALTKRIRQATEQAAREAVRAGDIRDTLAELVAKTAAELLPDQAKEAVEQATPDVGGLYTVMTDHVRRKVAALVDDARPGLVKSSAADIAKEARRALQSERDKATAAIGASVDEAVDRKLAEFTPNIVEVHLPRQRKVRLGSDTHQVLPELLIALNARCHVLLVGPAGTGKSMLAKHAAEALKVPFQALSLGPTTPMSKVFGYFDAHGAYHDTPFRQAFEHGGVMLLDELDNGHPGLLAELNQALALGTCAFADRMVEAHEDFRLVATGNTYGTGASRQYVGRQTLDAATLDRFVVIDVPIDEGLEERIALRHAPSYQETAKDLVARIRDLRRTAEEKKLPVILSPRASIDGAKLLQAGATVQQVIDWRVSRGLSESQRKALGLDA